MVPFYFLLFLFITFGSILCFKLRRQQFRISYYGKNISLNKSFHIEASIISMDRTKHGGWFRGRYYFSGSKIYGHHYDVSFNFVVKSKDGVEYYISSIGYQKKYLPLPYRNGSDDLIQKYERSIFFIGKKVDVYFDVNGNPFLLNPFEST